MSIWLTMIDPKRQLMETKDHGRAVSVGDLMNEARKVKKQHPELDFHTIMDRLIWERSSDKPMDVAAAHTPLPSEVKPVKKKPVEVEVKSAEEEIQQPAPTATTEAKKKRKKPKRRLRKYR